MAWFLQGGAQPGGRGDELSGVSGLGNEAQQALLSMGRQLPAFKDIVSNIKAKQGEFEALVASARPEELPVDVFEPSDSAIVTHFRRMLLLQAVRPDRVLAASHMFVDMVLGEGFMNEDQNALKHAIEKEVDEKTPVLAVNCAGYDFSGQLRDVVVGMGKRVYEIALGSGDANTEAEKRLGQAAKEGNALLLKNAHLATGLMSSLQKKLASLQPAKGFRLMITTEVSPKLPALLITQARVFLGEAASGLKASLLRNLAVIPGFDQQPVERSRVLAALAWLHSVITSRLAYVPRAFSKAYEMGNPDLKMAADTVNAYITEAASGRTNLPPEKIPFPAIQALVAKCCHGGRVGSAVDARLLTSFVERYLNPRIFESDFVLVETSEGANITLPDSFKLSDFEKWAHSLPANQSPEWLSLPANAERVLLTQRSRELTATTGLLHLDLAGTDINLSMAADAADAVPWMETLAANATGWLSQLPDAIPAIELSGERIKDPLFRYHAREVAIGRKLLGRLRSDLTDIIGVCNGTIKATNQTRAQMADLNKNVLPVDWTKSYTLPPRISPAAFVADFALRCEQFQAISAAAGRDALATIPIDMGLLCSASAYLTATRQHTSAATGASLEKLKLTLDTTMANGAFEIANMRVEGAALSSRQLRFVEEMSITLDKIGLRWLEDDAAGIADDRRCDVPLYTNGTRAELLAQVPLIAPDGAIPDAVYQRGVALCCSHLS